MGSGWGRPFSSVEAESTIIALLASFFLSLLGHDVLHKGRPSSLPKHYWAICNLHKAFLCFCHPVRTERAKGKGAMNALIALRVEHLRMALYAMGISTIRKFISMVLELSLSLTLTSHVSSLFQEGE